MLMIPEKAVTVDPQIRVPRILLLQQDRAAPVERLKQEMALFRQKNAFNRGIPEDPVPLVDTFLCSRSRRRKDIYG